METRFAKVSDFDFLVEGLESIRLAEKKPKDKIKANASDKRELSFAIKNKLVRILEINSTPAAFIYFRKNFQRTLLKEKFLWVDLIYTRPSFRKKGLAQKLYSEIFQMAKRKKYPKIVIDIYEPNINSKKFHKKIGFRPLYTIYEKIFI